MQMAAQEEDMDAELARLMAEARGPNLLEEQAVAQVAVGQVLMVQVLLEEMEVRTEAMVEVEAAEAQEEQAVTEEGEEVDTEGPEEMGIALLEAAAQAVPELEEQLITRLALVVVQEALVTVEKEER